MNISSLENIKQMLIKDQKKPKNGYMGKNLDAPQEWRHRSESVFVLVKSTEHYKLFINQMLALSIPKEISRILDQLSSM